jgi:hypothetical protein
MRTNTGKLMNKRPSAEYCPVVDFNFTGKTCGIPDNAIIPYEAVMSYM